MTTGSQSVKQFIKGAARLLGLLATLMLLPTMTSLRKIEHVVELSAGAANVGVASYSSFPGHIEVSKKFTFPIFIPSVSLKTVVFFAKRNSNETGGIHWLKLRVLGVMLLPAESKVSPAVIECVSVDVVCDHPLRWHSHNRMVKFDDDVLSVNRQTSTHVKLSLASLHAPESERHSRKICNIDQGDLSMRKGDQAI